MRLVSPLYLPVNKLLMLKEKFSSPSIYYQYNMILSSKASNKNIFPSFCSYCKSFNTTSIQPGRLITETTIPEYLFYISI